MNGIAKTSAEKLFRRLKIWRALSCMHILLLTSRCMPPTVCSSPVKGIRCTGHHYSMYFLKGHSDQFALISIGILYFLFIAVFYTMNNISFNVRMPLISNDAINQIKNSTLDTIFTCVGSLVDAVGMPLLGMLGGSDKQSCVSYSNWHRISSDLLRRNQASGWKESPLQPTVLAAGLALALVLLS